MIKPHTITVEELQQFLSTNKQLFASSSRERKTLLIGMNGSLTVEVNGVVMWEGIQPFAAVEAYNSLTFNPNDVKF